MSEPFAVAIVGGGVAGLAVANAFAFHRIPSVVIEKTPCPGEVDRGDVLHHSSVTLIKKWHIEDVLAKHGPLRITSFRILKDTGDELFHCDLSQDLEEETFLTVLKHPEIERFLEEGARRTGLVDVRRHETCIDLLTNDGSVVGVRTNRGEYHAALTVLANGARSDLRDRYFGRPSYYDYPVSFYNACFRQLPQYARSGYYVLGDSGVLIMVPLPQNEMRIGVQYHRGDAGQSISKAKALELIGARLRTLPLDSLEYVSSHVYRVFKSLSRRWSISGAVLAGDAAHTTHPAGGQGMNLAFQDADSLAELLADHGGLDSSAAREDACNQYGVQRCQEVRKVLRRTHVMGLMGGIRSRLFVRARECVLKCANRTQPLKRAVFRKIVEVR